ncbi:MAG TPA: SxtJ family membrane protein [Puia sp.]|jgi:hypothetical protein
MEKSKKTETLLVIVLGCVAVYLAKRWSIILVVALVTGLAGLLVPVIRDGIHWGWMKLSEGLGWVSGKVILTVMYFLVLVPLAFFARWRGKIGLRLKPGGGSYFKDRDHLYTKEDLVNPW